MGGEVVALGGVNHFGGDVGRGGGLYVGEVQVEQVEEGRVQGGLPAVGVAGEVAVGMEGKLSVAVGGADVGGGQTIGGGEFATDAGVVVATVVGLRDGEVGLQRHSRVGDVKALTVSD